MTPVSDTGSGSKDSIECSVSDILTFTPIVINGNYDLINQATTSGWEGNGTPGSPFIIEDLVVQTSSMYGVQVQNVNMHVLFRNCSLLSAMDGGFYLRNSQNIHFCNISTFCREELFDISGCMNIEMEMIDIQSISVSRWARVYSSRSITVSNSSIYGNMWIYYSHDIVVDNITGTGGRDGVSIMYSSGLTIRNSTFETMSPVDAQYTDDILVMDNVLNGSRMMNFMSCNTVEIIGNMNISSSPYGLKFGTCSRVSIRDNDLQGNLGAVILTDTGYVEMYNNTLGSEGLLLSGSRFSLDTLIIPVNNTVNGDLILFMKDGNLTPLQDNPHHSQIILLNMPGFSLYDQEYDWNPCPLQVFYSSDISLNRLTISNASTGFTAQHSSGILIEKCQFKDFRDTAVQLEQCDGIRIDDCSMNSDQPESVLSLRGCTDFDVLLTSMELDYGIAAVDLHSCQAGSLRGLDIQAVYGSVHMELCYDVQIEDVSMKDNFEMNMEDCQDVIIRSSEIISDHICILMSRCTSMVLENNNLSTNRDISILDRFGSEIRYYSNRMMGGGIRFEVRSTVMVPMELPSNNTLDGRPIIHMTDEDKRTINESEEWGQIILNGVHSHAITGLDAQNRSYPIQLISCSNIRLLRCNFRNTTYGILSHFSFPITLSSCEFHNTDYCIVGYDSAPLMVENCIFNLSRSLILVEREYGDTPVYSIKIRDCTMINCTYLIEIEDAEDVEISGCAFTGGTRGISIHYGRRSSITDCTFYQVPSYCISYRHFMDNEIRGNLFMNCTMGVTLDRSYGNSIYENLFIGSASYGLRSEYTYNEANWFYRNIFIENNGAGEVYNASHPQAFSRNDDDYWNNSYKKGNYWSDWTGPDENDNGIVDSPYPIPDGGNSDLYPLADLPFKLIGSPQKVKGSAGNGYIIVSWKPPIWNRLLDVEGYRIFRTDSTGNIMEFEAGPEDLHFNDTTIVNGRRYTYELTAMNLFDESHSSVPISVIGDGAPPIFSSISPESGSVFNTTSVKLEWDCYDTGVGMGKAHVSLDGGNWKQAASVDSHTFFNLSDGNHTVTVRAFDMIGNQAETSIFFIVDTTPPEIIIRSDFEGHYTNRSNSTIEWSAVDELSGLDYYMISVNGAKWVHWGAKEEYRFEDLITAQFNISVMAVDKAGNEVNGSVCFFCDIDPPEVEIGSPMPGSNFEGRSVYFSWSVNDTGSGISVIQIDLDGSYQADVTDKEEYWIDDILPGSHVAKLFVEDISGNSAEVKVEFTTGELPQITSFFPVGGGVEMSTHISFDLSKDIRAVDFLIDGVNGIITVSGSNAVFKPDGLLSSQTEYLVVVTGYDIHDLPFGPFNWSFTTIGYARVIGKVVDQSNRALVGVEIFVDGNWVTPTDYTGSFELLIARGHYVINLYFKGYLNRSIEIDVTYGQLLDLENIIMEKEAHGDSPEERGKSSSSLMWVAIVVAVLVLIVLIVLLLLMKRKAAQGPEINEIEEDPGISEDDPVNDSSNLYSDLSMVEEKREQKIEEDFISEFGIEPME